MKSYHAECARRARLCLTFQAEEPRWWKLFCEEHVKSELKQTISDRREKKRDEVINFGLRIQKFVDEYKLAIQESQDTQKQGKKRYKNRLPQFLRLKQKKGENLKNRHVKWIFNKKDDEITSFWHNHQIVTSNDRKKRKYKKKKNKISFLKKRKPSKSYKSYKIVKSDKAANFKLNGVKKLKGDFRGIQSEKNAIGENQSQMCNEISEITIDDSKSDKKSSSGSSIGDGVQILDKRKAQSVILGKNGYPKNKKLRGQSKSFYNKNEAVKDKEISQKFIKKEIVNGKINRSNDFIHLNHFNRSNGSNHSVSLKEDSRDIHPIKNALFKKYSYKKSI